MKTKSSPLTQKLKLPDRQRVYVRQLPTTTCGGCASPPLNSCVSPDVGRAEKTTSKNRECNRKRDGLLKRSSKIVHLA